MGFDEFISSGGFQEAERLRNYVSDLGDYQRLIERYEEKEPGEKLFVFNVTMQNHGGYEEAFPDILFAVDGEVYNFNGYRCIVIGGAYSVDKHYRLAHGWHWWPDEQPDETVKAAVEARLAALHWNIDIVLSHTCPRKYEPTEVFLSGLDQSSVDKSTEDWLDSIEDRLDYKKWYCGHYHTRKQIDKMQFMFEDFDTMFIRL